jgi:hypothetical protein
MTALKKPKASDFTIDPDLSVRLADGPSWTFASRSALEDVLTFFLRRGAAMGWTAGQNQLATTGEVESVSTVIRGPNNEITGIVKRNRVVPGGAA